jgi:uncharacterized protein DUF6941
LKIITAFLADHAVAHPNGKIDAIGAGIDTVTHPAFPARLGQMAVAFKVALTRAEQTAEHVMQIRYVDAADGLLLPLFGFTVGPSATTTQTPELTTMPFVYTLRSVPFPQPGTYSVKLDLDGAVAASMDIRATVGLPRRPIGEPVNTLSSALSEGFQTFLDGDTATAAVIFRDLARRFPASANVHNNLGFTLLAQGRPQEALDEFRRAEAGKYGLPELLRANIACCLYLIGDFKEAHSTFAGLLTARPLASPMILFALGRTQLHSLILNSPADYIALMALNGARCAMSAGNRGQGEQLIQIARAGLVTFSGSPENAEAFKTTLLELEEDLTRPPKSAVPS